VSRREAGGGSNSSLGRRACAAMRFFSRARRDSTEHDELMAIDADEAALGAAPLGAAPLGAAPARPASAAAARAGSSSAPRGMLRGLSRSGSSHFEEQASSFAGALALPAEDAPAPAREGRSPRRRSLFSGSSKAEAAPEPQEGDDLDRARGEAPGKVRRLFFVRLPSFKTQVLPVAYQ
jgi:hypothetical protein